jgi:myo-inositol 2-dehydrogenase/D-chiro-inositol 1-dehydrogenase
MSRLRVGIVGAGGISVVHAEGWAALDADLSVFSYAGAAELAERFGMVVADDLDELIRRSDIVDIVTPSGTHRTIALAAIAAGRHVVCEKPLGATIEDARAIVSAAEAAGVRVFPAHVVRYFPEYATIHDQIADGAIGTLGILRFTRTGEAPQGKAWFFDERAGGGLVRDLMIHDLDQAVWLAGDVVEVFGVQNPHSVDGVVAPPVVAHAVLTHANGAISHLEARWGAPGTAFRTTIDAFGSRGMLEHDSAQDRPSRVEITRETSDAGYVPSSAGVESPFTAELRDYAAAIAEDRQARVAPRDGAVAVALAEAVMESIATARPVPIDPDRLVEVPSASTAATDGKAPDARATVSGSMVQS